MKWDGEVQSRRKTTTKSNDDFCFARGGAIIYCFAKCKRFYARTNQRILRLLLFALRSASEENQISTIYDNTTLLPTTTAAIDTESFSQPVSQPALKFCWFWMFWVSSAHEWPHHSHETSCHVHILHKFITMHILCVWCGGRADIT